MFFFRIVCERDVILVHEFRTNHLDLAGGTEHRQAKREKRIYLIGLEITAIVA